MSRFSYGAWAGGPDPLAGPLDVRSAVDALGRDVLEGRGLREALRDLLRRGEDGRRGLRDLAARTERRRKELRRSGDLAGPLRRAREQLAQALDAEREALAMEGDEDARAREDRLDALPRETAQAVRELEDYDWRSPAAEESYRQIREQLREEVLGSQFQGLKQALEQARAAREQGGQGSQAGSRAGSQAGSQAMDRLKDLLADLNALLAAHARGEDTDEQFAAFMARHGDAFGDDPPQSVEELVDELARQAAAAQRMLASMSPAQRAELAELMGDALGDAGLEAEMAALTDALRALRPGMDWRSRERFTGSQPLSFGEGASALAELSELDDLADALGQDYPGATLDDVDVEAVERQLGAGAAADVRALQQLEAELRRQGWVSAAGPDELSLTPKALRRLGQSALATVFAQLRGGRRGGHDERSAGAAGEPTGGARAWQFGDEQPIDAVRTVSRAVLRTAAAGRRSGAVTLDVEDFAVVETERRTGAAVALCVDLSYSMYAEDRWGSMKQTALALDHLISTRFPQDQLQVIGFDRYARTMTTAELAAVQPAGVQGTNLQHALALARRHVARHPGLEPVVLVVTDGEPTAHLEDGEALFWWPPLPETVEATLTEVDVLTRSGIPLNTFVLGEDPSLRRFVDAVARRNGGRVFAPSPERLGELVVTDYLRSRRNGAA